MTVRDCYEACLIELNKVQAPSLLIDDFVYLLNKSIQEYFNKKYISFEKYQQNTDDLRHLINMVTITPIKNTNSIYGVSYNCPLPSDYVHILGCRAIFDNLSKNKCSSNSISVVGLNKLNSDQAPQIGSNYYMRPSYNRPYYQIINIEQDDPNFLQNYKADSEKNLGKRYGNSTQPMMQILCGDDIWHPLKAIEVQYLQAPRYVMLTQDDLDSVKDTTQVLEFSDYVCNEIVKQLVGSILENQKDERLQTFIPINQSIPQT